MARYNAWQNGSLVAAADTLSDGERWQDRGAFFGSIAATFNHLLWDDALWLARFTGETRPELLWRHHESGRRSRTCEQRRMRR
ncbi:DinB family protein [uncultured Tateyamaria sp.]|uniref:DinB family protein n=1 Tax=uncultured Tateyamaria sp. TaxID=455651 RepID=UPI00261C0F59|nr:DinB family protein [uncultured Tateyamaria sp.]